MSASVLVAYATMTGSTVEVAEVIASVIRETGLPVDVLPVSQVDSLEERRVVILGAALYMGRFRKAFRNFLNLHRYRLAQLHPYCFILGPTRKVPADFEAARNQAAKEFARFPWLEPADVHVFGGRSDPKAMPLPFGLARLMAKIPVEDIRDWDEIRKWALDLAHEIRPAASRSAA